MAKAKSLEEFLREKRGLTNPNSPKSFAEYMQSRGISPITEYTSRVRSAITKSHLNDGKHGTRAEKIDNAGLSGGGYQEYLSELSKREEAAEIERARQTMEAEYLSAEQSFEKYLEKHSSSQIGKMQKLEDQLVQFGIMRLDETYAIGIDYGLSPEDAATVSATVYRTLRDEAFDKCIRAAQNSYMNEQGLRGYAESLGLLAEDVDKLVYTAGKFLDKGRDRDFTDLLEKISNE